jgi:hypothetical protein
MADLLDYTEEQQGYIIQVASLKGLAIHRYNNRNVRLTVDRLMTYISKEREHHTKNLFNQNIAVTSALSLGFNPPEKTTPSTESSSDDWQEPSQKEMCESKESIGSTSGTSSSSWGNGFRSLCNKWFGDKSFMAAIASRIDLKRVGKAMGFAVLLNCITYVWQFYDILFDTKLETVKERIAKFAGGLCAAAGYTTVKTGVTYLVIEALAAVLSQFHTAGKLSSSLFNVGTVALGPLISTICGVYYNIKAYRANKLTGLQTAEAIGVSFLQGVINTLLSLGGIALGGPFGVILAVVGSMIVTYGLSHLEQLRNEEEGKTMMSILWSLIAPAPVRNVPDPEDFLCPITLDCMKVPAHVKGHYFELSAITRVARESGIHPLTKEPFTEKDIVIDKEMQRLIRKFKEA